MAKSLTRMIDEVARKYGCAAVSVTRYNIPEFGVWWSATANGMTRLTTPCVSESTLGDVRNPKEALRLLCEKLDALIEKQEAPARFQATAASWFRTEVA